MACWSVVPPRAKVGSQQVMGTRTKRAKWPKIRSPALEFWHSIIFALSWSNFGVWNVPTLLHSVVHTSLKRKRRFLDPNPGSSRIKGVYFHSIFERTWIFKMSLHAGHYMVRCLHLILISAHRPFNVVHDEHIYHVTCQFIQQNRIHLTENYEHWDSVRISSKMALKDTDLWCLTEF